MNSSPLPPGEPIGDARRRRIIWIEDTLILVCIGLLWLPLTGARGAWVSGVMLADLALMVWLLIRRKRRVDDLFAELRRKQEAGEALHLYPGIPGIAPPVERPTVSVGDQTRD